MKLFISVALILPLLSCGTATSAALQDVEHVFAGSSHVCARLSGGSSVCWGLNYLGELGNGNRIDSPYPVAVAGLGGSANVIHGGNSFTCAVTTTGSAKCWGGNGFGQLGIGSIDSEPFLSPMSVNGLGTGVAAVTTGDSHACALLVGGGVRCWGNGELGRLGNGGTTTQSAPVDVTGLSSGVAAIAARDDFTCARMLAGTIKCWGGNSNGKLGTTGIASSSTPIDVPTITGATAIALGSNHTCALSGAGRMRCWGANFLGQLGDGTLTSRPTPMNVSGFASGVAAISAGNGHTCALTTLGSVSCWGGNFSGQLGNPDSTARTTPTAVAGLSSGVAEISLGSNFSCARATDATVRCWGSNGVGALGDGEFAARLTPRDVVGLGSASTVGLGEAHSCAVGSAGVLQCWGRNRSGELGNGNTLSLIAPAPVSSVATSVVAVDAGYESSCALTAAGAVLCWGNNEWGQLGDGTTTDRSVAAPVTGLGAGVTAIAAGRFHYCVIVAGAVKCWGRNVRGQLGDGNFAAFSAVPVDTLDLPPGTVRIAAGSEHTCAVTAAGAAKCWGYNQFGQLGTGDGANLAEPGDVVGLASGVLAIAAGQSHTCATTTAGAMRCWGRGAQGRLGSGTLDDQPVPANVVGMTSGVTAFAAGGQHTCAVRNDGVTCWGSNNVGALGDGTVEARLLPTPVVGLASGMAAVYAGDLHTCARSTGGLVRCWGLDDGGQVGDGGRDPSMPTLVIDGDRLFASGFEPGG